MNLYARGLSHTDYRLRVRIAADQLEANSQWFVPGKPLSRLDQDIDTYWLDRFFGRDGQPRVVNGERLA